MLTFVRNVRAQDEGYFGQVAGLSKRRNENVLDKRAISCTSCKALLGTAKVSRARPPVAL